MQLSPDERYYLKLKAAYLYYKEDKTQSEIAKLFHISRPTLIKLINEAKEEGIITFEIHDTRMGSHHIELEQRIRKKLDLKDVKILSVGSKSQEAINSSVGSAAANYFLNILESDMTVGIGWGNTLQTMTNYLHPDANIKNLEILPLLGALHTTTSGQSYSPASTLCERVASNFANSTSSMLLAPLIPQDEEISNTLRNSNDLQALFEKMKHMDIAIIGIDGDPEHSTTIRKERELQNVSEELIASGSVGNVCSHFYDANGNFPSLSINGKMITVPIEDLQRTPFVIGAAGGEFKAPSIIGAARAKLFNVLITDEFTAKRVASIKI
ncbi:hypothetical protein LJC56_01165 [Christensenellaceae bacterium OttesenSCG-928-K19]|nr:hypothetical protein [Christensenellaceae bacterium OttesenSCG-928-K19]